MQDLGIVAEDLGVVVQDLGIVLAPQRVYEKCKKVYIAKTSKIECVHKGTTT